MINHAANSSIGERDWVAADKLITGNVFHTGMCVYVCVLGGYRHTHKVRFCCLIYLSIILIICTSAFGHNPDSEAVMAPFSTSVFQ